MVLHRHVFWRAHQHAGLTLASSWFESSNGHSVGFVQIGKARRAPLAGGFRCATATDCSQAISLCAGFYESCERGSERFVVTGRDDASRIRRHLFDCPARDHRYCGTHRFTRWRLKALVSVRECEHGRVLYQLGALFGRDPANLPDSIAARL
jgi:hypothetical protein